MFTQLCFSLFFFCTKLIRVPCSFRTGCAKAGLINLNLAFLHLFALGALNVAHAQSLTPPSNVSALIYSSSAAELFWTPSASAESGVANRMQVKRNGELLGVLDARSLFQPNLSASQQYNYELRSVDSIGRLSEPVVLSLSTNNFSLPIKRVYPAGQSDTVLPPQPPETENINAEVTDDVVVANNDDSSSTNPNTKTEVQQEVQHNELVQGADNCIVRNVSSLRDCINNANAYRQIDLANSITCDNNCCSNGVALLQLNNLSNLTINGHGHRLLRRDSQRQCSLLDMNSSSNVSFVNLYLDDDQQVAGCQVQENCARMVHIKRSANISFNNTHIAHGKGYAFYVQATNGFTFERSSLHNSGVLGMYIGHSGDASRNIRISNSTFSDNQTNGLALLGLTGQSPESNIVSNNVFIRNHRRGQWAVAPRFGTGFTGGGQLYIAQASNFTVRDNVLRDGFCENCFVQNTFRTGISGIELGLPNNQSVANVLISNNRILNHDGFGILQNSSSGINNVQVRGNSLLNNTSADNLSGASESGNLAIDTQHFSSFENTSDLGGRYRSVVNCSSDSSVQRRCGSGSRFGQCAVQLSLGGATCEGANVELTSSALSTSSGRSVVATGWVNNPVGQWCLVFRDGSGNQLNEHCKNIADAQRSTVQDFVGLPELETTSPAGSQSVELRVRHWNQRTSMSLDDLSISVGN